MQIIIPMSGFGERFRRAGYNVPKPLIEIEGKPILAHVVDLFPGETDFIFICNQDHLNDSSYHMAEIIKKYCPTGRIVGIEPHKLGPVYAVSQVKDLLVESEPVVVNYCDFTCYWDWKHFKKFVEDSGCLGAIPAYKGFHPHTLGTTNYAYMLEERGWVKDIREKQPFTANRMQEFASSGTYYFASSKIMLDAFQSAIDQNLNVGGEYYVSLAYKPIIDNGGHIAVYPLQHFMQWGTPEDVIEYNYWSKAFNRMVTDMKATDISTHGTVLIPMAGIGKRFIDEGYEEPKPIIPISGMPMVAQARGYLPAAEENVFVLRRNMFGYESIVNELKALYPQAVIKTIDQMTDGQACTANLGLNFLVEIKKVSAPITIGACDNGALYDLHELQELFADETIDVIVWGIRGYPNALRNLDMYGWVDSNGSIIKSISVKTPLKNPESDPIVIGTFTFRNVEVFQLALARLIERDGRINGEFYIDSLINDAIELGMNCRLFEVDTYLCWGTPNDLKTFEYWQSCFHKWPQHPYSLELDNHIPKNEIEFLIDKYKCLKPDLPGDF